MKIPTVSSSIVRSTFIAILSVLVVGFGIFTWQANNHIQKLSSEKKVLQQKLADEKKRTTKAETELNILKNQDQVAINNTLKSTVESIQKTFKQSNDTYEDLVKLKEAASAKETADMDKEYALILDYLADENWSSAEASLKVLAGKIDAEQAKLASSFSIPANAVAANDVPGSGFRRQKASTSIGEYLVDIVAADLNSTRVVVDTASDGDCRDNCPVMALGDFVARSGGFAGINGPYFCPASYPSCAGKTNSFDTLLMNKNKVYFNSDNNVYSTVPAVIFSGNSARYVGASQEWGRDTGVDAVIANQPLLVLNGNVVFGGDGEVKRAGKGSRSFIGSTGSTVYIGVVHNASVAEAARVLKEIGVQNALNLDSGGSTALWSGGYKVGPGRALPFGIVLQRK